MLLRNSPSFPSAVRRLRFRQENCNSDCSGKHCIEFMLECLTLSCRSEIQRGSQKLSNACKTISSVVWTEVLIILVVSWFHNDWLSAIQNFKSVFFMPFPSECPVAHIKCFVSKLQHIQALSFTGLLTTNR
jgi:hypothetical protein